MYIRIPLILAIVFLSFLATGVRAARTNLVENTFSSDAEGWQVVDLPDGSRFVDAAPASAPTWSGASSPWGAHIAASDATTGTIFFAAPTNVVAQLGIIYGSFLEFDLTSSHQTWTGSDVVVIRGSHRGQIRSAVGVLPSLPTTNWVHYTLRLVASSFRWDDKGGALISPREFRDFLRTSDRLWIPAEFGTGPVETTRLRNVRIVSEEFLSTHCVPALTLDGFPGQQFRIEYLELLGNSTWQPLTNITIQVSPYVLIDTSALNGFQRYYRAVELP